MHLWRLSRGLWNLKINPYFSKLNTIQYFWNRRTQYGVYLECISYLPRLITKYPGVQGAGWLDIHFIVGTSCERAAPLAEKKAGRAASRTEKSDKPAQWTPCISWFGQLNNNNNYKKIYNYISVIFLWKNARWEADFRNRFIYMYNAVWLAILFPWKQN
jgi:hypothetical protein